jgi:tetratricopeptide (TPR) repeat protein
MNEIVLRNQDAVNSEAIVQLAIAQAHAWERLGRWDDAVALLRAVRPAAEESPTLEGPLLTALAHTRNQQDWFQGPTGEGDKPALFDRLEQLARERDDKLMLADVLHERGLDLHTRYFHDDGDLDAEEQLLEGALELRRAHGDEAGAAWSLIYLGTIWQIREDSARGVPMFEEAEEIGRRLDVPLIVSYATRHLGMIRQEQEAWEGAEAAYRESLTLREELNWVPGIGTANHALGAFLLARGESDRARQHLERAHELIASVRATFMLGHVEKDLAALPATS